MDHDEFTGEVQHRLELGTSGEAVRAIRAVLTTLGERVDEGAASDLAGPLPMEIDRFLLEAESAQQFDFDVFVDRVAERADADEATAAYYTQSVVAVVREAVPGGAFETARDQLPPEFGELFELVDGPADSASR